MLVATALVSRAATRFTRHVLKRGPKALLQGTIFINIERAVIWTLGICIMLSTCFNVDVSTGVAALGIGGIALSLGLKDTISNLMGGIQVTLMGIVSPGDHVRVGVAAGLVEDVSWRQTTVRGADGTMYIIPNAQINATTLEKLVPASVVKVNVALAADGRDLDTVARQIEKRADEAAARVDTLVKPARLCFTQVGEWSVSALLVFEVARASAAADAADAVVRAIAPLATGTRSPSGAPSAALH